MMDIQEAIRKKRSEIQRLEDAILKLEEAKKDLAALERTAAILGIGEPPPSQEVRVRARSTIGLTVEILKSTAAPFLHVDKILEELKEKGVTSTKISLVSSLAKYEKKRRLFCRGPEPNSFGLIDRQKSNGVILEANHQEHDVI